MTRLMGLVIALAAASGHRGAWKAVIRLTRVPFQGCSPQICELFSGRAVAPFASAATM